MSREAFKPRRGAGVMAVLRGPPAQRLAAAAGRPADEARAALRDVADAARGSGAFPLMATICRTLADPRRLLVAAILKREPGLTATELQAALACSQATVSHHMRRLVGSGIVVEEREGRYRRYRLEAHYARLVP